MLRYEILSILRNKTSYIFLLLLLVFGLKATVELQNSIAAYGDSDLLKRELQYELVMQKQMQEQELFALGRDSDSDEKRDFNSNWAKYRKWSIKELQELIALLDQEGAESETFQKKEKAYYIVRGLATQQTFIYTEYGCEPVEVRFREKLAALNDELNFEAFPFDISAMTGTPYTTADLREASVAAYENNMKRLEYELNNYDKKSLGFDQGSPYAFLEILLCKNAYIPMIINVCMLLFSFGCVMEAKHSQCYQLVSVQPKREWRKYWHYVGASFAATGILCLIGIGVWLLYWGITYGFDGFTSNMFVDTQTYRGFLAYEHLEDYSYVGISRMYADYKYVDGGQGVLLYTRYPLESLPMYRFLLYLVILAFLKSAFLILTGTGIGMLFHNQQRGIGAIVVVTALMGCSQITGWGKPYNPFAITSVWSVTLGTEGITWLNAVLELALFCVVITAAICAVLKKKDKA